MLLQYPWTLKVPHTVFFAARVWPVYDFARRHLNHCSLNHECDLTDKRSTVSYRIRTGWYDRIGLDVAATDIRSLVGKEFYVGTFVLQ
jgi:hypothetical protein